MAKYVDSILHDYALTFGKQESESNNTSTDIPKRIQDSQVMPSNESKFGTLPPKEAMNIVENLKNEHVKDLQRITDITTENAQLKAKIDAYEAINRHVDNLSNTIDELTQKYIQTMQIRTQQAALIKKLSMEIDDLKALLPQEQTYGRF
ncbi:hypothetical protein TVAG_121890 [Trichomonas vaginalis G3]|uniref:Uncharacterized protein n=1 Tax=Trichomonas vaginalis (strain ATCC PRA-98 / G3) TaxID=412133 RepID=A2E9A0_TRIV3|nr:hypothetical protein TVAGG3_0421300 [Trichomonas vaginalis G3]EAY10785.1 hypothetical protein TVAG_121890 [Trichomonas vaginalis G3]KAI5536075.1 hypothetical protein TVAGG3_0421300 [Trichomonas vaginalis G3]|eukprot:XP_001323008.1 hypothetical protein [Trichomonas vaginalis G3]